MDLLLVNVGSSSTKLRVIDAADAVVVGVDLAADEVGREPGALRRGIERCLAGSPTQPAAAGHRVVHGGSVFTAPTVLSPADADRLATLSDLAPLHNPPALAALHVVEELVPGLRQVACFDTSFHVTLPDSAATYPVPRRWTVDWGLRRVGFHGLSHAWASRRAADLVHRPSGDLRLVTAHLGSGASLAAVLGGRSVDTTMGFTPLEGVVMATRSGSVDPGLLLHVQRHFGLGVDELEDQLEHHSGLLGLSGRSGDLREVLEGADRGDALCLSAYGVYLHRLRAGVAAMAASMGGVDALVFTGGAGEGSARLRADTCAGLEFLGFYLDARANETAGGSDAVVSRPGSEAAVAVVVSREDLEMARQVRAVIADPRTDR